jgi:putative toxin-antitoxin system antitoxin component (TIGR02293 family)
MASVYRRPPTHGKISMQTPRVATLCQTLGLKAPPENGMAWHRLILEGFSYRTFKSLAKHLGLKESELFDLMGISGRNRDARKKSGFTGLESDVLYRWADAFVRIAKLKGVDDGARWLREPQKELKNNQPLEMLKTTITADYVFAAIAKLLPRQDTEIEDDSELASTEVDDLD